MLVRLIQIEKASGASLIDLREIYVNPRHVVSIADDVQANRSLINEAVQAGLDENVTFSRIILQDGVSSRKITVVGSPSSINAKINSKQVLRG
jgi:hypothetical protein